MSAALFPRQHVVTSFLDNVGIVVDVVLVFVVVVV
jgi:hypothetical protein